jgi:SAM-dependent methyltransferase
MNLAAHLVPIQTRFVRPLADAADCRDWVPSSLSRALRRIDGTCSVAESPGVESAGPPVTKVCHPIVARLYAGQAEKAERLGLAVRRSQLLASLSGRVIEIGAGTGANFTHYPTTVEEVVAIEPEPFLRRRAEAAALEAAVPVRVIDATAERLPFGDEAFGAGIVSLVLCSVADPSAALDELFRVIRAGGELRFNEHVRSTSPAAARLQRTADRLGWARVSGGCHVSRDTETLMRAAGFQIDTLDRYRFRIPPLDPSKPHIIGTALKPANSH